MLPNNLKYMNKVESSPCRQYTSTIQPQNGTGPYLPNNKIIINIPTSSNTVLVGSESFLKFNLDGIIASPGTATNFIRLDKAGAHGIFQRLITRHGSTLIEDIDNYGALVSMLMPLQQTSDSFAGKLNVLAGTSGGNFAYSGGEVLTQTVGERLGVGNAANAPNSGAGTYAQIAAAANLAARTIAPRTYALNLVSYLGSLSGSQYIPLFEMTSTSLTLELQIVSTCLKFLCMDLAPVSEFVISNVEFVGTFIELSDESINIIRQSQMGQPLQYVTQCYSNLQSNITLNNGSTTSVSIPIAAKYASLKSLFAIMRNKADGQVTHFPYGAQHFNLAQWRIRVGSQILPAKAPNTIPEHYAELIKAIGSLSDMSHEPSINWNNYNVALPSANAETNGTTMTATTKSDCFALGFDFESYSNSNKDKIFAGMNTLNSDIFWNLDFNSTGAATAIKFDFFALYDQVIMFENGMVRVVK